jgi:anaerobic magnesium-protoporphyrin IX monomethyl ester cyclase
MERGQVDYTIKNIWFKKNGQVIQNEVRPLIEDLDSLPMLDKDLYYQASPYFSQCYYIMTSRGCLNTCSYCCHSYLKKIYEKKGRYLRFRSVQNVICELNSFQKKYFVKMVRFHDDDMLAHGVNWLQEFASAYADHIHLPFACFAHPNTVTKEKAKFLKLAGCHDVEIGIQTISEKTRGDILNRRVSHKQLLEAIHILKDCGLNIITDNILGIPGQNIEEIIDLIRFHNDNRVMKIYCFGFRHYPKTDVVEYSRKTLNLSNADIDNLEDGINVQAFIQGGDNWDGKIKQLQTFFTFLLYFPRQLNNFLIKQRLYCFFPGLPYFISVIFSNWLRIPYRYNWALHITVSRYRHFVFKKLESYFRLT